MYTANRLSWSLLTLVAVLLFSSDVSAQVWRTDYQNYRTRGHEPLWNFYGMNPYKRTYAPRPSPQCRQSQTHIYFIYPQTAYVIPSTTPAQATYAHQPTRTIQPTYSQQHTYTQQPAYAPTQTLSVLQSYSGQPIDFPATEYATDPDSTGILIPDSQLDSGEIIGEVIHGEGDSPELSESEYEEAQQSLNDLPVEPPSTDDLVPMDANSIIEDLTNEETQRLREELEAARAESRALEQRARAAERQLKSLKDKQ